MHSSDEPTSDPSPLLPALSLNGHEKILVYFYKQPDICHLTGLIFEISNKIPRVHITVFPINDNLLPLKALLRYVNGTNILNKNVNHIYYISSRVKSFLPESPSWWKKTISKSPTCIYILYVLGFLSNLTRPRPRYLHLGPSFDKVVIDFACYSTHCRGLLDPAISLQINHYQELGRLIVFPHAWKPVTETTTYEKAVFDAIPRLTSATFFTHGWWNQEQFYRNIGSRLSIHNVVSPYLDHIIELGTIPKSPRRCGKIAVFEPLHFITPRDQKILKELDVKRYDLIRHTRSQQKTALYQDPFATVVRMREYDAIICGQTSVQIIALALKVPVFVVGNWIPDGWILHTRNCVTVCDSLELALAKSELNKFFYTEKSEDFLKNLTVNYGLSDHSAQ